MAGVLEHCVCKVEISFNVKTLILTLIQEHTVFTKGLFLNVRSKRRPTVTYIALRCSDSLPRSENAGIAGYVLHLWLSEYNTAV